VQGCTYVADAGAYERDDATPPSEDNEGTSESTFSYVKNTLSEAHFEAFN